jgi:hypothetical protein
MKKIGKNNKSRGKQIERNVLKPLAEFFSEVFWRNPDNGDQVADVESEHYVVEVKSKITGSPAQLIKGWSQAQAAEKQTGKKPYVVLSFVDKGKRVQWLVEKLDG